MSVSQERFKETTHHLNQISDGEWRVIMTKCKKHINIRLRHKRASGAHGEKNLGMSAFDYYFGTAIDKLYSGIWDWKFEKFTILEQLIRMIDSMISEVVRKYKAHHNKGTEENPKEVFELNYLDIEQTFYDLKDSKLIEPLEDDEGYYEEMIKTISEAVKGDDELEQYFLCVMEDMDVNGISNELNWPKTKVYKTTEKIQRRVRSYIKYNGKYGKDEQ